MKNYVVTTYKNKTPVASPVGRLNKILFTDFGRPKKVRISMNIGVFLYMFAVLANVDLNLRLKIYKIAILSSVKNLTCLVVAKRRVSKSSYG